MLALYVQSSGLAASKFLERVWFYYCLAKDSTGIKGASDQPRDIWRARLGLH